MNEIIIFLGPSLSLVEAEQLLKARYFPPARQGDLLSAALQFKPKIIGLIDGYFMQTLSVWHKEILHVMELGVVVVGASSMGALRAAEMAPFGMHGVGKIFEAYQNGTVEDDDEVVLMHGPAEEGYIPFSIPLINLRFTLEKALDQQRAKKLFALIQSFYYPERTFEKIEEEALKRGFSKEEISFLQTDYVDQKKEDAKLLLKTIATFAPKEAKTPTRSPLFEIFYQSDRRLNFPSDEMSSSHIAQHVALHHPKFAEVQFHALNQVLASQLAKLLQVEVSEEEKKEERERFFFRSNLKTEEEQSEWLLRNHLSPEEFSSVVEEKAKARKLHRSFTTSQLPWKQNKALLEELKWTGQYEEWVSKTLCQEQVVKACAPAFLESEQPELYGEALIEKHFKQSGWNPDIAYHSWAIEAGFIDTSQMKMEMLKSQIAREYLAKFLFS